MNGCYLTLFGQSMRLLASSDRHKGGTAFGSSSGKAGKKMTMQKCSQWDWNPLTSQELLCNGPPRVCHLISTVIRLPQVLFGGHGFEEKPQTIKDSPVVQYYDSSAFGFHTRHSHWRLHPCAREPRSHSGNKCGKHHRGAKTQWGYKRVSQRSGEDFSSPPPVSSQQLNNLAWCFHLVYLWDGPVE